MHGVSVRRASEEARVTLLVYSGDDSFRREPNSRVENRRAYKDQIKGPNANAKVLEVRVYLDALRRNDSNAFGLNACGHLPFSFPVLTLVSALSHLRYRRSVLCCIVRQSR